MLKQKLKELREEKGKTQQDIAVELKLERYIISNWEQGRTEPNINQIISLADYYQISIDELLEREDYATGNIEIKGEILSEKEKQLVKLYRSLDEEQQVAFQTLVTSLPAIQSKKNKR